MKEPGSACGNGLCETAAKQLQLPVNTPVATSIIDAHAGGLGKLLDIFQEIYSKPRAVLLIDIPLLYQ